jgi:hypothetical protein
VPIALGGRCGNCPRAWAIGIGHDWPVEDAFVRRLTSDRGLATSDQIEPTHGLQFLAYDVVDRWAGLFGFALSSNGDATSDGILFHQRDGREWEETVSGGGRFGGFNVPWTRPVDGWHGRAFLSLGCSGKEFDDGETEDEDASVFVLVHVGFVRQDVAAVEVSDGRRIRTVPIASPVGAFTALTFGDGESTWRYVDGSGAVVDEDTYSCV